MVSIEELAASIAKGIEEKLHVRGADLATQLRRAGRLMPRHVRRDAQAVADALPLAGNPKLARRIDLPRLEASERRVMAWLKTVDPNKRRVDLAFSVLGSVGFSVFAVLVGLVAVLVWRGSF